MIDRLAPWLRASTGDYGDVVALGECLSDLRRDGLDQLPLPGGGQTLARFRALAEVGGHDLALCKLYEGHTDALAILAELEHAPVAVDATWGTWCAGGPRLEARQVNGGLQLHGRKAWCSGAAVLSHALLTATDVEGRQQLVAVALRQPGVEVTDQGWQAVGMARTRSVEVVFDGAHAQAVGGPEQYLTRPGFWQGGVGIAACWFGAARRLGQVLQEHCQQREEPHALAHLGAVDTALYGAGCVLREAAEQIDLEPGADCQLLARRVRAVVEHAVEQVIHHTGRALGAGPYCQNLPFARLIADLPVFVRQSHAERDLAALGQLLRVSPTRTWSL
ncbi:acyl-CoA dehydrogenase family protein [Pseudomonas sp. dw_358]|uniref:acyl-CoA dehydrogenase family protein n=1 Tax=Pseudomonas sp. dw_358 TaxID=2720083 RepID=UPI001BD47482|nr:acyl-CoA dehydrogenase family protein [Pseudomonas sp. dw_358]